eukprot:CCRYP_002998-RC/>CCRYP_002998-RC protein AED:0.09 eAED:0.09 QI:588/1/1/1/0.5/0.33/3/140/386
MIGISFLTDIRTHHSSKRTTLILQGHGAGALRQAKFCWLCNLSVAREYICLGTLNDAQDKINVILCLKWIPLLSFSHSLVEYADILWYQKGAPSYAAERNRVERKYGKRMSTDDWYKWRDEKVLQEIYRYGAYIDYWMENGMLRDPISHRVIDQEMWEVVTNPTPLNLVDDVHICHKTTSANNPAIDMVVSSKQAQVYIDHGDFLGLCSVAQQNTTWWNMAPSDYAKIRDPQCGTISRTCSPTIVISADKLRDYDEGPIETHLIATHLKKRMSPYMISDETWPCIWKRIIHMNEGPMTFDDRKLSEDPNFSAFMLEEMMFELSRMINKYGSEAWRTTNDRATRLVELFTEHRLMIWRELKEVQDGSRTLKFEDFLGPNERKSRGTF